MTDALKKQGREESAPRLPPGMTVIPDIMTAAYEAEVISFVDGLEMSHAPQPEAGRRFTRAYGWGYDPETYDLVPADPLPVELEPVRHVVAEFAGIDPEILEHCMVSRFDAGAMIPWLKMRPIWERLIGVALGNPMPMQFRSEAGKETIDLTVSPRSLYLLSGASRDEYEHCFPATSQPRWCLWFRDLSEEGRRITAKFGNPAL